MTAAQPIPGIPTSEDLRAQALRAAIDQAAAQAARELELDPPCLTSETPDRKERP